MPRFFGGFDTVHTVLPRVVTQPKQCSDNLPLIREGFKNITVPGTISQSTANLCPRIQTKSKRIQEVVNQDGSSSRLQMQLGK